MQSVHCTGVVNSQITWWRTQHYCLWVAYYWLLIVFTFLTTLQHKLNAGCCLRNYFIYSASLRHLHSYYKRGIILVSTDYKRLFLLYLKIKTYNWITGNWKHYINWEKTETERKTEIYKAINTENWKLKAGKRTMQNILYN